MNQTNSLHTLNTLPAETVEELTAHSHRLQPLRIVEDIPSERSTANGETATPGRTAGNPSGSREIAAYDEPWTWAQTDLHSPVIRDRIGMVMLDLLGSDLTPVEERNVAARVVACVNFCAGISNERLAEAQQLVDECIEQALAARDPEVLA